MFFVTIIGLGTVFAGLSFYIYDHILIGSTSLIGSYAFIRGISLYAGGYPNEFTIAELIKQGLYSSISPWFYAYLVALILVFAGSMFV